MGIRAHIVLALCVMLSAARVAPAAVLSAGQLLRVTFNTTPGVPVPDTLSLHLGIVQVLAAHTSRTGALYDGNAPSAPERARRSAATSGR